MRLTPDQITTFLGVAAAFRIYFQSQGIIDAHTATLLDALLAIAAGYYTNKKQ